MSKTIGGYIVTRKLGSGGMATVYLAEHKVLETKAALKVLLPNLTSDASLRQRFVNEAKMMAGLNHPNIVHLSDFIERGENLVLVMEYVDGTPLDRMIGEKYGPIPWEKALPLFKQILAGVACAHSQGIVHRDLKPSNVLVSSDGVAKVTDFGIAKVAGQQNLTRTGVKLGTLCYMSPEQVLGKQVDQRTDIYSLGATLYEMLAGKMPRSEGDTSEYQIMKEIIEDDLPDPRTFYPHIPAWLVEVIRRAMARDKEQRISSCDDFLKLLEDGENGRLIGAMEIPSEPEEIASDSVAELEHLQTEISASPVSSDYRKGKTSSPMKPVMVIVAIMAAVFVLVMVVKKGSLQDSNAPVASGNDPLLFEKRFGTSGADYAWSIAALSSGGYLVGGYTDPAGSGNCNILAYKLDEEGEIVWDRNYTSQADQSCFSVQEVSDGYLLIAFSTPAGETAGDITVKKINPSGNVRWTRNFGDSANEWGFVSSVLCSNGSLAIVCGNTMDMEEESNVMVINIDPDDGDQNWRREIYLPGIQVPYSVCAGPSNSLLILGRTREAGDENGDAFLMKVDSNGSMDWSRTYGGSVDEWGRCVQPASDGGYILAIYTSSYGSGGDAWLVKVNSSGRVDWSRNYGGSGKDWPYAVVADDNGYSVAGRTESYGSGGHDAWLFRTDLDGVVEWSQQYGGTGDDKAYALAETEFGYVLAGMSNTGSSNEQFYVVTTDREGNTD